MKSWGWSLEIHNSGEKLLLPNKQTWAVYIVWNPGCCFFFISEKYSAKKCKNNLQMLKRTHDIQVLSLVVRVRASRGARHGGPSMDGGGTGGHPRTQLACLEAPEQFFVGATQTFLLVALFLHIHLQVGVLLWELPDQEKAQKWSC